MHALALQKNVQKRMCHLQYSICLNMKFIHFPVTYSWMLVDFLFINMDIVCQEPLINTHFTISRTCSLFRGSTSLRSGKIRRVVNCDYTTIRELREYTNMIVLYI